MRLPLLLASTSAVVLAGCHSAAARSWQDVQRSRLARLHSPRSADRALSEVLLAAPTAQRPGAAAGDVTRAPVGDDATPTRPQDPAHLDQRLPARDTGPRRLREAWQPLAATVDVGLGTISARVSGTRLDDRSEARFVRARLDAASGAALHVEFADSDSDLFAGVFVNDGVDAMRADAQVNGIDVFPHVRFDGLVAGLEMPVRLGVFTDLQQLDHQHGDLSRRWLSIGPRVVFEPQLRLAEAANARLELFGRVGGDLGYAWFTDEYRNGQDRDTTLRWSGELGAGLRGRFGRLHTELGYRVSETTYGPLQTDLLGEHGRSGIGRQQFYVGFGVTY